MNLAYTMAPGRGDTDLILFKLAKVLAARGLRCCGTVQINSERGDTGPCDMDVQVLARRTRPAHQPGPWPSPRAAAGLTRRALRRR